MDELVLDLADGRRLGYSVWGPPDAPPILYCHGFPTNRQELLMIQPVLEQRGVEARIVVLSRPGYGASTFQPNRSFLDWPQDVAEAADRLGIDRFAVLGVSGGSPYALACGHSMADRVSRLGIVVGMAPIEATGMANASAISGPSARKFVRRFQFGMMAFAFNRGREDRFLEQSNSTMGEADRLAMERPEMRDWMVDMMQESLAQGGRAATYEAGLYRTEWGFKPEEVELETQLWYGGADKTVPASAGLWLADRIPNSSYVVWPEHGHFTWMIGGEAADVVNAMTHREPMREGR